MQPNKTSALDVSLGWGVYASTFGGTAPPLKICEGKNVQKSVRFTTTFEFERKYLWKRWRQRQNLNGVDENDLLRVEEKNFCEIRLQAEIYAA